MKHMITYIAFAVPRYITAI